jgi:UDP-GlcNAc3NAcA epimerase
MKILHVVGNRPQFIKLAILHKALLSNGVDDVILHTGQHFDGNMSDVFFVELEIPPPNYSLGINQLSHNEMIGRMLMEIDPVLSREKPAAVIVYGDTNSTLAGALAAKKRNIPVIHIEAGVRTMNEKMPEETNRYITDRISSLNFCSTYLGVENLQKEGYFSGTIHSNVYDCGDILLDSSLIFKEKSLQKVQWPKGINPEKSFVLTTIHREENTGNESKLKKIIGALNDIHQHVPVVFAMHPKTRAICEKNGFTIRFSVCDPLGYLDILALVQNCQSVITDSGGLSREAFFFSKPTLVLMQNPFWPELFIHGNCLQSEANAEEIVEKHSLLLSSKKLFNVDVFGKGNAAENISKTILSAL